MQVPDGGDRSMLVARLGGDGLLAGTRTFPGANDLEPGVRMTLGADDRVVIGYYGSNGWSAVRMNPSGAFTRLVNYASIGSQAMATAPDGEAVVVGSYGGLAMVKTGTVDPAVDVTSGPSGKIDQPSPTFGFSSNEPEATFACSWDGGEYSDCASPETYGGSFAEGDHTFRVRATDPDGRTGISELRDFTVSDGPPETTIVSGPAEGSSIGGSSVTFAFTADEAGATYRCSLDGAAPAPCSSPQVLSGLAPGRHVFTVAARDGIGNVDPIPATRSFAIAPPPPPVDRGCERAKKKLAKAKAKLKKARRSGSKAKVKKARAKVKKAKAGVRKAC
jgi:hypothetical protein